MKTNIKQCLIKACVKQWEPFGEKTPKLGRIGAGVVVDNSDVPTLAEDEISQSILNVIQRPR